MNGNGGVFEAERVPNPGEYIIRTANGELALRVELNGDLFPVQWHAAMMEWLERRWVHRVAPPLKLVVGDHPRPFHLRSLPLDDPYGLPPAP